MDTAKYKELVGKEINCPVEIAESGRLIIFGFDPGGNPFVGRAQPHFLVKELEDFAEPFEATPEEIFEWMQ